MSRTRARGGDLDGGSSCQGFLSELLLRCGRGEAAALVDLVDLYRVPVLSALASVDRRAPVVAQEEFVVQAFLQIWRRSPSYQPGAQSALEWLGEVVCAALGTRQVYAAPG